MGGLNALAATFSYPKLFASVAVQSPLLFSGMMSAIDPMIETLQEDRPLLYIDWGKYDLRNPHEAWDMGLVSRRLYERLEQKGWQLSGGEVHDGSGWASWRNRTDRIFEALFPLE
jgi:enterochelin esterase-like enzyme